MRPRDMPTPRKLPRGHRYAVILCCLAEIGERNVQTPDPQLKLGVLGLFALSSRILKERYGRGLSTTRSSGSSGSPKTLLVTRRLAKEAIIRSDEYLVAFLAEDQKVEAGSDKREQQYQDHQHNLCGRIATRIHHVREGEYVQNYDCEAY